MKEVPPGGESAKHQHLVVQVRYLAVAKPLVDPNADGNETFASLKARSLTYFSLVEGDVEGGRKVYVLSHDGEILQDLQATVASVANGRHEVQFKLLEQFIQG